MDYKDDRVFSERKRNPLGEKHAIVAGFAAVAPLLVISSATQMEM